MRQAFEHELWFLNLHQNVRNAWYPSYFRELLIVSLWLYKPCGSERNFGKEMIDFRSTKKLVLKKRRRKKNFILSPMFFQTGGGLKKTLNNFVTGV